jgi:DNA-binding protein YbaB
MFQEMKDMYKMQKQAKAIKKELSSIHIEAEVNGVIVVVAADQELISIYIPDELMSVDKKELLSESIMKAHKKATKKSQEIAAEKMKGMMGGMGLPGM